MQYNYLKIQKITKNIFLLHEYVKDAIFLMTKKHTTNYFSYLNYFLGIKFL